MYEKPPKKMLIINILDILKRYTDENHRLSQKEIVEILKKEYDMIVDRKAVKRNLMNLIENGSDIEFSESIRRNNNNEEESIYSDWYLNREFDDSELRLLIDSLLFSKHIPYSQCKELIEKLKGLSNTYFSAKVKHIRNLPENMPTNKQLFYTIDVLDEAISKSRQIAFSYCEYGTDKKMHHRANADGTPKRYIVNPYQIVATNGRYYLIGNYDKYDNVSHYRVDHITDIELQETPTKPTKNVKGLEHGLNLPTHMAEHIYMFAGESVHVQFRAEQTICGQIIDWFGMDAEFSNENGETVDVTVIVNENAMFYWLMQYGKFTEVLKPLSLRDKVKAAAIEMTGKYGGNSYD